MNTSSLTSSSLKSAEDTGDAFRIGAARVLKQAFRKRSELACPYCSSTSRRSSSACKVDTFVPHPDINMLLQHVRDAHSSKLDEFTQIARLVDSPAGSAVDAVSSLLKNNYFPINTNSELEIKDNTATSTKRIKSQKVDIEVHTRSDCMVTKDNIVTMTTESHDCNSDEPSNYPVETPLYVGRHRDTTSDSSGASSPKSECSKVVFTPDEDLFFPQNRNYTSPFLNTSSSKVKTTNGTSATPYASQRRLSSIYSEFAFRMDDLLTKNDLIKTSANRSRRVSCVANIEPEETAHSALKRQSALSGNSEKTVTTEFANLKCAGRSVPGNSGLGLTSHQAALWPLWELIDIDKTGEVSVARIKAAFEQVGLQKMHSREHMETMFKCADFNGDGTMDWNKFYRFFKHLHHTDLLEGEDREEAKGKRRKSTVSTSFQSSLTRHMSGNVYVMNTSVDSDALGSNTCDNSSRNSGDSPFTPNHDELSTSKSSTDSTVSDDEDDPEDIVAELSPEKIRDRQLSLVAQYSTPLVQDAEIDSIIPTNVTDNLERVSVTFENTHNVFAPRKSTVSIEERKDGVKDEDKSPKATIIVNDSNDASHNQVDTYTNLVDCRHKRRMSVGPTHRVLPTINIRRYEVEVFGCLNQRIKCISMSPRRPLIAACHRQENTVHVYDLQGREMKVLTGHKDSLLGIAFSVDKKAIATASRDKTLTVWDSTVGRELGVVEHPGIVTAIAFSADGTNFYTGCQDNIVRRFHTHKCRYLRCMEQLPYTSQGVIVALATQHHANEILVCSRSCDKCALVLEANTLEVVASLEGHVTMVWQTQFNADGSRIVTLCEHRVIVWEAGMLVPMQTFESKLLVDYAFPKASPPPHPSGKKVKVKPKLWTTTLFCPAKLGTLLVCFGTDASVLFFDYVSGELILQLQLRSTVYCAATTDDGDKVVCGDDWGNLYALKLL
eukprot:Tbor_TRINITY_DN813_c0_g1::TRINITY_DN813_c0_g1_i1::g.26683::m.26683